MSLADGLISTKLTMPPLKARMVERTHLLDRLREGKDRRLIVISGVAGSGKTCLVCQWLIRDQLPVAWYSLDHADNHSDLFLRYLLAALSGIDDPLVSACGKWLNQGKKLVGREVLSHISEYLSELRKDAYLVLDDYHFVSSKEIHGALFSFIDHLPARMHVVVTSRHSLPFSVPHFKMRNQVVEISASDMKFTEGETVRFFTETIPVRLSSDAALIVWRHVEGWVGGLQLFSLSLKGREVPEDLSACLGGFDQDATDYLVDEVISVQSEKVRRFLEVTALLDRFNADLCQEITGMTDSSDILADIYKNNLFLVPLDSARKWFRYHHLLSVAIRGQVAKSNPQALSLVHQKAALWFARKGYLEDAFQHAFASDDLEFAADMLEDYLMDLYDRYEIASFRRWLSMLPEHVFMERTLLRLLACRFDIESIHLLQVKALLDDIDHRQSEAFARYEGYKRKLCEDQLLVFRAILPFWLEPHKVDPEELEEVLGRISLDKTFLPGMTKVIIGSSYFFRGEMLRASEKAYEATTTVLSSNSLFVTMLWFRLMAGVERWQGHLHGAEAALDKGFSFLRQKGLSDSPLSSILCFEMAWVAYERNDLERALDYLNTALKYLDQAGFSNEIATGYFLRSLILLGRGETEDAGRSAEKIKSMSTSSGESYSVALANAFSARLAIAQGDYEWAERWSERRQLALDEPFSLRFAHECLAVAELHYGRRRFQEAIQVLKQLHDQCESRHMGDLQLDADLLLCAAFDRSEQRRAAKALFERALSFAETEGYVRPFVNRANQLSPVLLDLADDRQTNGRRATHLESIIKAGGFDVNRDHPRRRHRDQGRGGLTAREFEILGLLSEGYKYDEIANKCFISLDTVRTHVKHVFEKLKAKNRTQAIAHATSFGILRYS
jgi:LuxR family transcriptional regulator, maltose regulon positive regulatory protein